MSAVLEPVLTIEDLEAVPDDGNKYELIEGELYVSCAPDFMHQVLVSNLILQVGGYLKTNPIGLLVPGPGVIFNDFNGVIPDLIFIKHERLAKVLIGGRLRAAPELMIEILSPGLENERRDRQIKRQLYSRFGVKEYWILDPKLRAIELYRLTAKGLRLIAKLTEKDELTSRLFPDFSCPVKSIFAFTQ